MEKRILFLLVFLTFLASSAFAQDILATISSLLAPFVGVIFILIFILILLAIGGVLPKPTGRLPIGIIAFIVLIALLFIIPFFIEYPQAIEVPKEFTPESGKLPPQVADFLELIGLPKDWAYVPAIIYLFVLPFAAIYTLVWAFLNTLKVFEHRRVNIMLALIITFLTIPMGWFIKIVWILFSFMGIWSVLIFTIIFILGVFFRGFVFVRKEYEPILEIAGKSAQAAQNALDALKRNLDNLSPEQIVEEINRLSRRYNFEEFHRLSQMAGGINLQDANQVNQLKQAVRHARILR